MTDFIEIKAQLAVDDTGHVSGLAWPFGSPDHVGDEILPGAFKAVAAPLPMLFQHDQTQVVGVWEKITETAEGLTVKGRLLVDEIARAREVRAMLVEKAVTGLSIGFKTKAAAPSVRGRTITALDLFEVSLVAVPCHPAARITTAKSAADDTAHPSIGEKMENETTPAITPVVPTVPANDAPAVDLKAFETIRNRLDALEAKAARSHGVTITGPAIHTGDERKAFTDYLRTGDATELKALAANSGTGGILAPETVSATIIEKIAEFSPVRGIAQTIAMNGPLLQLPRLVTEVTVGEVAELEAKPESEPTFEQIDLKPFEMGVMVPVSRTLIEDAQVDISGYLANHIARRFGQKEASWFVTGNGTSQAEGVLTSTEVQVFEHTGGLVDLDAINQLFYGLPTAYAVNGVWLMNRRTMSVIRAISDGNGVPIWQPSLASGQPPTLYGRPVLEAVDMPDPAPGGTPIVFGDFATGYAIADRIGFEVIRDELTGALNSMVKFVARRRVGGRVILGESLVKLELAAA